MLRKPRQAKKQSKTNGPGGSVDDCERHTIGIEVARETSWWQDRRHLLRKRLSCNGNNETGFTSSLVSNHHHLTTGPHVPWTITTCHLLSSLPPLLLNQCLRHPRFALATETLPYKTPPKTKNLFTADSIKQNHLPTISRERQALKSTSKLLVIFLSLSLSLSLRLLLALVVFRAPNPNTSPGGRY